MRIFFFFFFFEATLGDNIPLLLLGNANNCVTQLFRKYANLHQNNTAEFFRLV